MSIFEEIAKHHVIKDPPSKDLMKFLGMINTYPKNATFATQNPDENVVMVVRKHIFRNISWVINALLAFFLPLIMVSLVTSWDMNYNDGQFLNSDILRSVNAGMLTAILLFYYGFVATYIYFSYIHWFYDVFIITNNRYISIDFDILNGRTIVDLPLSDIIDVSEKVLGFLPAMIGYGNIEFKTLSEKFIVLDNIPYPTWFRDSFVDLIQFIRLKEGTALEPNEDRNIGVVGENKDKGKLEKDVDIVLNKDDNLKQDAVLDNIGGVIEQADMSGGGVNSSKLVEP